MARRRIKFIQFGKCSVSIYRDVEWGEYVIQGRINGQVIGGKADGGAFETDKKAARSTAAAYVRELRRKRPACRPQHAR